MPDIALTAWEIYYMGAVGVAAWAFLLQLDDAHMRPLWQRAGLTLLCGVAWPMALLGSAALLAWDRWRGF